MSSADAASALPRATSTARWKPIRAGLLNLYRYDYEEFHFEDGHLLLRGNNGTGKSRVLALQLPFLLDGEIGSSRVEPDGDPAKRFDWNLLLDRYEDRMGYTWLEFGHVDGSGVERYCTIGCGLRATKGAGISGRWYFVTPQRIGRDLFLQSEAGQPLTKERLAQALAVQGGRIYSTAADYRRKVDETLFRLGETRYEALVNLLIELRKPQLSRKLEEEKLSKALSDALPPLSMSVLGDVADAFKALEDQRNQLDGLSRAQMGAAGFLVEYQRYLQVQARKRAAVVRSSHQRYEQAQRQLRSAEEARDKAGAEIGRIGKQVTGLRDEEARAEASIAALSDSEAMRDARRLDDAIRRANELAHDWQRADEDRNAAVKEARTHADEHRRLLKRTREMEAEVGRLSIDAEEAAKEARLDAAHQRSVGSIDIAALEDDTVIKRAREVADDSIAQRKRALERLDKLHARAREARKQFEDAQRTADDLASRRDVKLDELKEARQAVETAAASVLAALRSWCAGLHQLTSIPPDEITDALNEWSERAEGDSPAARLVRDAERAATTTLAEARAALKTLRAQVRVQLEELRAEKKRLLSGVHRAPPSPYTRNAGSRAARDGAPLWHLCDFRPGIGADAAAGVEAGLEGAGLLDAWVMPDGRLLDAAALDTTIVTDDAPVPERHLGELLLPRIDPQDARASRVSASVVEGILRRIGLGRSETSTWVDVDGAFSVGPLRGRWTKPAAEHIGEGAREQARRQRLEALAIELAAAEAEQSRLDDQARQLDERENLIRKEARSAPTDAAIRSAVARRDAIDRDLATLRSQLVRAAEKAASLQRDHATKREELERVASDLGLAGCADDLRALERATSSYREVLTALWPALRNVVDGRSAVKAAANREADAVRLREDRAARAETLRTESLKAAQERDTLQSMVGQAAVDIRRRLAEAQTLLEETRRLLKDAEQRRGQCNIDHALAVEKITEQSERLQGESEQRETGIRALARLASERLLSIAVPSLAQVERPPWSATRGVEIARAIEDALKAVDADDRARETRESAVNQGVQTLIATLSPHGYPPSWRSDEGLVIVEAPYAGRTCTIAELRDELENEVRLREQLLTAREREIIENHLMGEVATHLHELLRSAETLVQKMNEQIRSRPTSTGMTLKFVWEPVTDAVPGLADARRRLMRATGALSPAERESVGAFLHDQIKRVRLEQELATWHEQLAAALDYRRWHRFYVERQQDGVWKRLTRRTHGTGSGGEKAIALTIPQFAAAAAHYSTADTLAPRLILLDEAFVGVDNDMRAKCMGLLKDFDLDFVMTSEREWACYGTLPGVAICHLTTRPGSDAVFVSRWLWNGRQRVRVEQRLPSAAPSQVGFGDLFGASQPPTPAAANSVEP